MFFHIDFNQEYRKVEDIETIFLKDNWENQLYQRSFWGLKKSHKELKLNDQNQEKVLNELYSFIDSDDSIDQAVYSPNHQYILYRELEYNDYQSNVTDDVYCYYKIYSLKTGNIIEFYKGYREWFDIAWQE